jgi:cysteine desulfurase/selenocysteine lyase
MSDFDVERLRQDTPACRDLVHFNNAGAALMPRPVVDAVVGHLRAEERFGGYEAEKLRFRGIELRQCGVDSRALG